MAKKRGREEVEKGIVRYLEEIDFPTTTTNIAKSQGLNWYSALAHLTRLESQSKVFHRKVGRQDQWWTENVDESRKKIREMESILKKLEKKGIVVKKGKRYKIRQ